MLKLIKIDENSRIPKYKQIVDSIIYNISVGNFEMDQKIPSINLFSEEFYLSRDTVEKAYSVLKERNIITAIRGKGYYISRTKLISKTNILFLVNKLSSYKLITYNSFLNRIGHNTHTDLHIYHCDESLFLNLINKHKNAYDYYMIMLHFKDDNLQHVTHTDEVLKAINSLPKNKLILMDDIQLPNYKDFTVVYQYFKEDIYNALNQGFEKISKYTKIILIYPEKSLYPYPKGILQGFKKFCINRNLNYEILDEVYEDMILKRGDLFITIAESDLVNLIKQVREDEFKLGEEIGIISYNDTPLKELLGITVISVDFKIMGETAANVILNNEKGQFRVPFNFIERNSI